MFHLSRVSYCILVPWMILSGPIAPICQAQGQHARQESHALGAIADEAGDPSAIIRWNIIALQTTRAAAFNPLRETRALAIVSSAVFDAVNSITGRYERYFIRVPAQPTDSVEAAVHAAAHDALVALYPEARATLDSEYDAALAALADGPAKVGGVECGRAVAAALLAWRSLDHADDRVEYQPGTAPGAWAPTPPASAPALEPGWGKVTPFFLKAGSQYRPGPPPSLTSPAYVADFTEIASLGSQTSPERNAAQTETARFWMATAPQLWNQAVQQLAAAHRLRATATAFVFLVFNAAGADAMIVAWDSKYTYNQWRPVTAIRAQLTDPAWTPLIPTPPFPDYIAGHTTYAGAAEAVLSHLFGERPRAFSMTSATANGAIHTYSSFRYVADEVVNARVWGGVHWRTSCNSGRTTGKQVGGYAFRQAPRVRAGWRGRLIN